MSVIMARLGLRGLSRSLACLAAPRAPACTAATAGAGGSGSSRVAAAAGLAAAAIGGGVALAECSGGGGAPTSDELAGAVTMDELIGNTDHLTATEGTITVNGLQVKWWRYENTAAGVPTRTPLVALHGGPAFTHNYSEHTSTPPTRPCPGTYDYSEPPGAPAPAPSMPSPKARRTEADFARDGDRSLPSPQSSRSSSSPTAGTR